MPRRLISGVALSLWLAATAIPVLAFDTTPQRGKPGEFGVSLGAEYTTGEYGGTTSTDIWYFPLSLRYETGRWLWWVTIPYLIVEGPGNVIIMGGGGMGSHMTATTTSRTESGLGDIIAAASYRVLTESENRPAIDVAGKVYLGTADEDRGLGTGENDFAAQVSATKDLRALTVSGTVGYLYTGDPAGMTYRDIFYGRVDVEHDFNRHTLGAAFEAQEATLAGNDRPAKVIGYFSTRPGEHTKLTAYLLHGLSDSSPDWGLGVTFAFQY